MNDKEIKCQICEKIATWYDISAQKPNEIISACDDHLPIDCGHDNCEKFSDRDENNGIRTTTCFNRTWRYNKDGWIKNKRGCIRPVDNIRGLQSKPKQMI